MDSKPVKTYTPNPPGETFKKKCEVCGGRFTATSDSETVCKYCKAK